MLTLSRERAIARAYLLAGDEDLREAVVSCQGMGVQVVLMGVASTKPNQSGSLRREADESLISIARSCRLTFPWRAPVLEQPERRLTRSWQSTLDVSSGQSGLGGRALTSCKSFCGITR
ncbi:MAG: hypothetical protein K6W08_13230 [Firmicutes bacterium]|nr:hypothetical protein [Bacillota bacterium]